MSKKTIHFGGLNWLVLNETDGKVFVLSEKSIGDMPFDTDNCNDWKQASLRKFLNGEFLEQLKRNGADLGKIIPTHRDLTADDGLTDYGSCEDTVTLLTVTEYRNYRYSIHNLDDWWWLATAYSTASNDYSSLARIVHTDGTLYDRIAYGGLSGVRPALTLSSEIFDSFKRDISEYSTEELLKEMLRREKCADEI